MATIPPYADLQAKVFAIPESALAAIEKAIVHANCPDGIASAMQIRAAFPDLAIEFVYHGTPEHQQQPCAALFCDFSPPAENAREWVDAGAIVLDHHATAKPVVEMFGDRGVFADEREHPGVSGALLAYMLEGLAARTPERQRFVELVGIRDTWQKSSPNWDLACAVASALTFYPVDTLLRQTSLEPYQEEAGRILYERRLEKARALGESLVIHTQADHRFLIFNDSLDKLTSDVGEAARAFERDVDFVAGFFYADSGQLVISMRSVRDGFDVGAIAKASGGGGHTKAAGFQVAAGLGHAPYGALVRALVRDL